MQIVPSRSKCAICRGELDRPYMANRGLPPFTSTPHLEPYYDAPLHLDCLPGWSYREEYFREYAARGLFARWRGAGTLLGVTPDWLLFCKPRFEDRALDVVVVDFATWPFRPRTTWSEWETFIHGGYRDQTAPPQSDVVDAVMAQVRELAPTLDALQSLRVLGEGWAERQRQRQEQSEEERPLVEFGAFVAQVWGDAAPRWDWELMEQQRRAARQARAEAEAEKKRLRPVAIARSNVIAHRWAAELASGGPLRCPHCRRWTHDMEFFDHGSETWAYFICRPCGRSFAGAEAVGDG